DGVQHRCRDVALHLSAGIAQMGSFELRTEGRDLPVFAFKLRDDITGYSVFDVSERLRLRGLQVPAYTFPADLTDTAVMRIVVRIPEYDKTSDLLLTSQDMSEPPGRRGGGDRPGGSQRGPGRRRVPTRSSRAR